MSISACDRIGGSTQNCGTCDSNLSAIGQHTGREMS